MQVPTADRLSGLFGALCAGLAGCAVGDPPATESEPFALRDSTGIEIVDNLRPEWGPGEGWTISPDPLIDVGGGAGDEDDLFGVAAVHVLRDGTVVVADRGSRQLVFFSDDGVPVRRVGGPGGGPGEFLDFHASFLLPGDTIAAYDLRQQRVTLYGPKGEFVRDRSTLQASRWERRRPFGVLPDGRILEGGFDFNSGEQEPGYAMEPAVMGVLETDGSRTPIGGNFPGHESVLVWHPSQGVMGMAEPMFRRHTTFGHAPGRILASWNHENEIQEYRLDGELARIVRWIDPPGPVTDSAVVAHVSAVTTELAAYGGPPYWGTDPPESVSDIVNFHETLPAHAGFQLDRAGNVWVHPFTLDGFEQVDRSAFEVIRADGRWLGRVEVPDGLRVLEIGERHVAGVWRDALDVEYVRVHELEKG